MVVLALCAAAALALPQSTPGELPFHSLGQALLEQADAALAPIEERFASIEAQDQVEFRQSQEEQLNSFLAVIFVLLALSLIIALVGIANTLALSVYERTREIGLLRAVGMTRRQLRRAIRWEAVIVSVFGLLFLSGLFADLFRWLLGLAFLAGLGGGAYYLARNKIRALKSTYDDKSEARRIASEAEAKERAIREQLEALKKKQR